MIQKRERERKDEVILKRINKKNKKINKKNKKNKKKKACQD